MKTGELKSRNRCIITLQSVLAIIFVCMLSTPSRAGLSYSVPPIQGTITDATSGQPIANAVLEVRWLKTVYGFFHPQTIVMKKMYVATDGAGEFKLPAYSSAHIFSSFSSVIWDVRHPLYSTDQLGIGHKGIDALKHSRKKPGEKQADIFKHASLGASGEIIFYFTLLSLNEKFKDKPSVKDFNGELYQEFLHEGPKYFSMARQLSLTVDADAIYKEWDEISGRFKNVEYIQSALKMGKEKIAAGITED